MGPSIRPACTNIRIAKTHRLQSQDDPFSTALFDPFVCKINNLGGAIIRAVIADYLEPAFFRLLIDSFIDGLVKTGQAAYMGKTLAGCVINTAQNCDRPFLRGRINIIFLYLYGKTSVIQFEFRRANITDPLTLYHFLAPLNENSATSRLLFEERISCQITIPSFSPLPESGTMPPSLILA